MAMENWKFNAFEDEDMDEPEDVEHMATPSQRINSKKKVKGDDFDFTPVSKSKYASSYTPCHDSHPPLPIVMGGKTYLIYGGSCIHPKEKDMDVFIGLDSGMSRTSRQYPWHEGVEFLYPIIDRKTPSNLPEFKKMLDFITESLVDGKKVFVGCIGGHGRTGIVLSALVQLMSQNEDAITYVRENYCKKVVETKEQVDWLHEHFGIKKVQGAKEGFSSKTTTIPAGYKWESGKMATTDITSKTGTEIRIVPIKVEGHIHGSNRISQIS